MISIETIPGMWGVGGYRKMVEGMNSSTIYLIYCKNFYKCHNVPPPSTTIKINKNLKNINLHLTKFRSSLQNSTIELYL
jgi:hypothetical protein